MIAVAEQRKSELMFLSERGVVFGRVETDADDADIVLVEIRLMVAKAAPLERASGCAGFDKKPQEHFCAAETLESHRFAVPCHQGEIGRRLSHSNCQLRSPLV